jgi:hypothetical protein
VGVIATLASGVPFTPYIGYDYANDGSSDQTMQKPDWAAGRNGANAIIGAPDNWFDSTAFVLPPPGEYGTVGRNSLRGPDLKLVDLSIFKNVRVGARNLQFRLEVFNLLNRANFATPGSNNGPSVLFNVDGTRIPGATQITHTVTTSRQVQLGLKVVF